MPGMVGNVIDCYVGDEVRVVFVTRDPERRPVAPETVEVQFGIDDETEPRIRPLVTIDRATGKGSFIVVPTAPGVWTYRVNVTAPVVTNGEGFVRAKRRQFEP